MWGISFGLLVGIVFIKCGDISFLLLSFSDATGFIFNRLINKKKNICNLKKI